MEMETECEYIHSKGNCPLFRMAYLAKVYDASVVSYLTWKLGVTFFLITLYKSKALEQWNGFSFGIIKFDLSSVLLDH